MSCCENVSVEAAKRSGDDANGDVLLGGQVAVQKVLAVEELAT
jgi:hypothetical protein